jgi:hypothetical protein
MKLRVGERGRGKEERELMYLPWLHVSREGEEKGRRGERQRIREGEREG